MCSDPLQKADMLTLVGGYLVHTLDMLGETRKKYTTSSLNDQRISNRQNSSKQHKKLGITGPFYILSRKKAFLLNWGSV